jgi:ubiquinone/menaquinone biosynthesis C-methylase UbiE
VTSNRPANFDRLAGIYDRLAGIVFGNTLHIAQSQGFEKLPANSEVAIFGGGSGRILEYLFATGTSFKTVYYIDASENMVALAADRIGSIECIPGEGVVQFFAQPAQEWCSQHSVALDAVITPFFLDCFEGPELQTTIAKIAALLRDDGQWLATDFVSSPKLRHRLLMAAMFRFFRISCGLRSSQLEPYFDLIEQRGLRSLEQRDFATAAGPVRYQRFQRHLHFTVDSGNAPR